jgi:glutaminase
MGLVIANNGYNPFTKEQIVPKAYAKIAKTLMVTCGMYDESGEYAMNVGIPSKSGVGGGIVCSVPHKYGIGVYGPSLNKKGNSVSGMKLLEIISKEYDLSIF